MKASSVWAAVVSIAICAASVVIVIASGHSDTDIVLALNPIIVAALGLLGAGKSDSLAKTVDSVATDTATVKTQVNGRLESLFSKIETVAGQVGALIERDAPANERAAS